MPILALPRVETKTEFYEFTGGLDQVSPPIRIQAGRLMSCLNYESDLNGGYRRIGGYERYDGRTSPSDATYQAVSCTITGAPVAGDTMTIGAATCLFVEAITDGMIVTNVTGTILGSTAILVSAVNVGTTSASTAYGSIAVADDAEYTADAGDVMRALIVAPTGSGAIRGVVYYGGAVYCFRDDAGATKCQMWKSSTSGWTLIAFDEEVSFSNANTSVGAADTLTQGGVTATVVRVIVESGSLASGVNTGRLLISGRAGGSFAAGAATSTGGGSLTLSGAQTQIVLSAGGSYQFDVYNFGGQQTTTKLYGCNGLDRCFEFDGTIFTPLSTGATTDKPSYIKGHRKYLYVAQGSSVMNSSVGDPTRWQAAEGASETAVGDTITGMVALPGEALGIMSRNSSFALTGASPSTWSLQVIRADVGAVARTVVPMGDTFMLDDRGIISVATSQAYGNFVAATFSRRVQPTIDVIRNTVVAAYARRQKNQYVLLCNDGQTVMMTMLTNGQPSFTTGMLSITPSCVWSGEDTTGVERVWVGASDGHVYELDKGSSFDGVAFEAFVKVWFNHSDSPRVRKRYRLAVLEMTSTAYCSLRFLPDFSYGDADIAEHLTETLVESGTGGIWNLANWNEFSWNAQDVAQPRIEIEGTGTNMALFFYSNSRIDQGHVLQGATIHYTPRRIQR
jgi:hypothetical protein